MGIIITIVSGAIVGWLGFRVAGYPEQSGCLTNIVIGIGGGLLGSALLNLASGRDIFFTFDPWSGVLSFVASIIGAAVLILGLKALGRRG
jgi:uncharacterized membrane protein YeaQ/YmgE (transglycosylase-associated protein family)